MIPTAQAQTDLPTPIQAAQIGISPPNEDGVVRLSAPAETVTAFARLTLVNLATLDQVSFQARSNGSFEADLFGAGQPFFHLYLDEQPEGGVLLRAAASGAPNRIQVSGRLSRGAGRWWATATLEERDFQPGEVIALRLDLTLDAPELAATLTALELGAQLELVPLLVDGFRPVTTTAAPNWSSQREAPPVIPLGTAQQRVNRTGQRWQTTLFLSESLPADATPGLYVPMLRGTVSVGDGAPQDWYQTPLFGAVAEGEPGDSRTALPVLLQIGEAFGTPRLPWALFLQTAANGQRGALALAEQPLMRLENHLRHPGDTTLILPPGNYPLEPTLLTLASEEGAPRVPLSLPGGQLSGTVTRPDGRLDPLGTAAPRQLDLTPQGPRLATLNEGYQAYPFTDYGVYGVTLTGQVLDAQGRRYTGGGFYTVTIAEALDMTPRHLPGAPFQVGDIVTPGLQLAPPFPADVAITVSLTDLNGDVSERRFSGTASPTGRYQSAETLRFERPGRYHVTYEARHTEANGRLWAARWSTEGVITEGAILQGGHGLAGYEGIPQAWYDTAVYPPDAPFLDIIPEWPRFSGDVITLPDDEAVALRARLTGTNTVCTATRPDVILRQLAPCTPDPFADLRADDRLDNQIGAGHAGPRPGDVGFLFGGGREGEQMASYAALLVWTDANDSARVVPPFVEPLVLQHDDFPVRLFVLPTGPRPGELVPLGERLAFTGQVGPPVSADVRVTLTDPSGQRRVFSQRANLSGGVNFDTALTSVTAQEPGVWWLKVEASYRGLTSLERLEAPYPSGSIPGVSAERGYPVFVVPPDAPALTWEGASDSPYRPDLNQTFNFSVPDDWTDVSAWATLRTDSALLWLETPTIRGSDLRFTLVPSELAARFPQLELLDRVAGASAGDVLHLSVAATGRDASGQRVIRARTFTLLHDRLYTHE